MQYFVAFSNKPEFATDGFPTDFSDAMREDRERIRVLYGEGSVLQAWAFDREEKGGALLFEAASSEALDELIASIPLVREGYNDYQVFPLAPFPGFAGP